MSITTTQNSDFIRQQVYSDFVLRTLHENLMSDMFFRDVGDFGDGDTLNIPTLGTVTLQEVTEDETVTFNPIESGRISLSITDYKGDAWYVTDVMKQDSYALQQLLAGRADESGIAIAENYMTRLFEVLEGGQTASNPNTINGRAHRIVGGDTGNKLAVDDFFLMKLAFDKANVPANGRIAIVDPTASYSLSNSYQAAYNVDSNPTMQRIIEEGIAAGMQYITNLGGFTVFESNLLPEIASGTDVDGTTSLSNAGVANLFMSVASDQTKPGMSVWRQDPRTETERDIDNQRDKWVTTCRYGLGVQRLDTLGVVVTETNV
jgi:hypothetical protein